jgi:transposase
MFYPGLQVASFAGHLQALLPEPSELVLGEVSRVGNLISIVVSVVRPRAACPSCNTSSSRVHSRYERTIRDLPWQGATVRLKLRCRRFYCLSVECNRKIFAERLPKVVRPYGRQTGRLHDTLAIIGHALGGQAGSRLADRMGLESSPDTILRMVRKICPDPVSKVRVLGVDDWAWKKGQRYGTILVDLERRCPVDLLPDRCAASFEKWLARNPGVEVIARDRASLYAQGATAGAPGAVQVADRFHLLCNLTAAVERALQQKKLIAPSDTDAIPSELESGSTEPKPDRLDIRKQERRSRRLERYTEVAKLYQEGHSQKAISRITGLQRKTVRRFLRAGQFPERATPKRKPSRLDRFRPYLERRWKEGCHNATQLWREIQGDGYTGGRGMVANLVTSFRAPGTKYFRKVAEPKKTDMKRLLSSPRQLAYLLGRDQSALSPEDDHNVQRIVSANPNVAVLQELAQGFSSLLRKRDADGLHGWKCRALSASIPAITSFVSGIERDQSAVTQAFSSPWSSGQVEGQVHRLKLIKRQMYGRAAFPLLRSRLLPFPLQE